MTSAVITKLYNRNVWAEPGAEGAMHVMIQHDDGVSEPFCFASFHYNQRYTDHAAVQQAAEEMVLRLGGAPSTPAPSSAPSGADMSLPTDVLNIWIESDIAGAKHTMIQHNKDGASPFCVASFYYDHRYTDNASVNRVANDMAVSLGATPPVAEKSRPFSLGSL